MDDRSDRRRDGHPAPGSAHPRVQARSIALYLPQFHPVPENDEWWGPGFTEWTNVARARPLFPGHYQPRIPGELGFYDLRNPETRQAQADLAAAHGVESFCYWHYWFGGGRRILDRPFREVLDSGEPDFGFCLGWANESWRGIWGGRNAPNRLLIEQTYPEGDDAAHFDHVVPAFHDPRYTRVDGRPLFLVYRPGALPSIPGFVERWQDQARQGGLPGLYLVGVADGSWEPDGSGFDAIVPWRVLPPFASRLQADPRARRRPDWLLSAATLKARPAVPAIYAYRHWAPHVPQVAPTRTPSLPLLLPGWDSSPRYLRSSQVFHRATPDAFGDQVRRAVALVADRPHEERIVVIRAWNEWSEGNYLEPDRKFGRGFLEAFRDAIAADRPQ
ncbi:MAG: lipopolysaccharide biosynthesis protein [Actinobacteria bacterium]|nr:lipopolysaccharide biosynthesis protein [Actinomycetota bacterium]